MASFGLFAANGGWYASHRECDWMLQSTTLIVDSSKDFAYPLSFSGSLFQLLLEGEA